MKANEIMQVTETLSQGLKREFKVVLPATELEQRLNSELATPEDRDEIEKAMDAKGDLAFTVALEVLPSFDLVDVSDVTVKKPVVEVTDQEINESLERMAKQNRTFEPKAEGKAEQGDRVVVDFVGRIDGTEFEGG